MNELCKIAECNIHHINLALNTITLMLLVVAIVVLYSIKNIK